MEDTISLKEILKILMKRWKLITLTIFISGLITGIISYYVLTPVYQASTQILVNQKNSENQFDMTQFRNNVDLINTYSVVIKSPVTLEKVINELDLKTTVDQLINKITVNSQENSLVISLTVEDNSPEKAVEIANSISETFQMQIKNIMSVDNVNILTKAELKDEPVPVSPNPILNIAIAIIVGMILGTGLAFLLEYLDNTLKDSQDIEMYLGLPVLGVVQKIPKQKGKKGAEIQSIGAESVGS